LCSARIMAVAEVAEAAEAARDLKVKAAYV